jgi:transcriptional regulator with XRE-family HTH domain
MRAGMFTDRVMSPTSSLASASESSLALSNRLAVSLGVAIRDQRVRRQWSVRELGRRSGLTPSAVLNVEVGRVAGLTTYARLVKALGMDLEAGLVHPRRRQDSAGRDEDPVHAAMGELEAAHLRSLGYRVSIDEPYQHYQLAGRADVIAWRLEERALLHLENRTRFPNLGEPAGAYNAKRAYLAPVIAERVGVAGGFRSVTHVMVGLWSSEVIHSVRLRPETFRSLCPDGPESFDSWWSGGSLAPGTSSTFHLLDPVVGRHRRSFAPLSEALSDLRPRLRGYAEAATLLKATREIGHA